MVFCFVIGNSIDTSFEVTGDEKTTISKLKEIIFEKNQKYFVDFDANKLRLWRVDIPWDSDDKLRKLELLQTRSPNENIIIQELEGKLLYPNIGIGDIFTQDSGDIRIIVQPPLSPATTGKCLPMVYLSNKKFAITNVILIDVIFFTRLISRSLSAKRSTRYSIFIFQ